MRIRTQIPIKSLGLVEGEQLLIQEAMKIQMMMTRMVTNLIMMVTDQELEEHLMEMGEGLVVEMEDGDRVEVRGLLHFPARILKTK